MLISVRDKVMVTRCSDVETSLNVCTNHVTNYPLHHCIKYTCWLHANTRKNWRCIFSRMKLRFLVSFMIREKDTFLCMQMRAGVWLCSTIFSVSRYQIEPCQVTRFSCQPSDTPLDRLSVPAIYSPIAKCFSTLGKPKMHAQLPFGPKKHRSFARAHVFMTFG